jgi:flavin reductase (DIM6/NTAB) family NADH-FMN oxidoreductase RutF
MAKIYYSDVELAELPHDPNVQSPVLYSLRAPQPQMFLVTGSRDLATAGPSVRTATMSPLSWRPYTKAVSVPIDDSVVCDSLSEEDAQCVLAEPTRHMLRQLTICSQHLPRGLSEAAVARFSLMRSHYVDIPSIADCPVNLECRVEHTETYYGYLVAFLRVVGASIDDALLFAGRQEITSLFPTNDVDSIVDENGNVVKRVALMGALFLCPTFPCSPKQGWYATFDKWMQELCDEKYLTAHDLATINGWFARWQHVFGDVQSPERAGLRTRLTKVCRLIVAEGWDELHAFLGHIQHEENRE